MINKKHKKDCLTVVNDNVIVEGFDEITGRVVFQFRWEDGNVHHKLFIRPATEESKNIFRENTITIVAEIESYGNDETRIIRNEILADMIERNDFAGIEFLKMGEFYFVL